MFRNKDLNIQILFKKNKIVIKSYVTILYMYFKIRAGHVFEMKKMRGTEG